MPSDNALREEIRARLDGNPVTRGLSIEVKNRVIYLSGGTDTREQQEAALEVALSVRNVKLVVNDMWLNNVELADRVKQALASDAATAKIPIDVDAKGGVVRLMSDQTDAEQRAKIVQIASAVAGVEKVEDLMR
jgi:osmotically-inducible protein OsmY